MLSYVQVPPVPQSAAATSQPATAAGVAIKPNRDEDVVTAELDEHSTWMRREGEGVWTRLFCDICLKYKKRSSAFGHRGSTRVRRGMGNEHLRSQAHQDAMSQHRISLAREALRRGEGSSRQPFAGTIEAFAEGVGGEHVARPLPFDRVRNHLAAAYTISTRDMSLEKMECLIELIRHTSDGAATVSGYDNRMAAKDFIESLASAHLDFILSYMNSSNAVYSIQVDESTDISSDCHMIIFVSFVNNVTHAVEHHFLGLIDVEDATAVSLHQALRHRIQMYGLRLPRMVGFGTDGASVMLGQNGVANLIRGDVGQHLINIHCICHRLSLGACEAMSQFAFTAEVENMMQRAYDLVSRSPKRSSTLESLSHAMEETPNKLKKFHAIRWLSRGSCLARLLDKLQAVHILAEEEQKYELATQLSSFEMLAYAHGLADILDCLDRLSKFFQNAEINFADIDPALERKKGQLREMFNAQQEPIDAGGPRFKMFLQKVQEDGGGSPPWAGYGNIIFELGPVDPHNEHNPGSSPLSIVHFELTKLVRVVCQCMDGRFPDLNSLSSFGALNPINWPRDSASRDWHDFGNAEIRQLAVDFSHLFENAEQMCVDWEADIKAYFKSIYRPGMSFASVLIAFHETYGTQYPDFARLLDIAAVMPVSTVPCERGFSRQNIIKDKYRNSMKNDLLEDLMTMAIEYSDCTLSSEKVQTLIHAAFELWRRKKERRFKRF